MTASVFLCFKGGGREGRGIIRTSKFVTLVINCVYVVICDVGYAKLTNINQGN